MSMIRGHQIQYALHVAHAHWSDVTCRFRVNTPSIDSLYLVVDLLNLTPLILVFPTNF